MTDRFVNIHTHRPTGRGIELRTAGIHPWNADKEDVSTIVPLLGDVQAVGETGLDFVHGADRETQLAAFRAQLALARERRLPVVLARRTARLLFWCSCIFLSHSACSASKLYSNAASRRQKCFKCHLYVYSIHPTPSSRQCPSVSREGRFVEVFHHSRRFMWKTNQAAVLLHPKEKKMSSERDFCIFLLLS